MDYSTTALVKSDNHIKEATDDDLIAQKVTAASRLVDRLVTGRPDVSDYFALATVTDEILSSNRNPLVGNDGYPLLWPHKPIITSVTTLAYRFTPRDGWTTIDPADVEVTGDGHTVKVWQTFSQGDQPRFKLTYTGGLAAAQSGLPADFVDMVTTLAVKLYKEAQAGYNDVVGVTDLGFAVFTKAFPQRFKDTLAKFTRNTPW